MVNESQICNLDYGNLPEGWSCNQEPHILSKNDKDIKKDSGYNISSILPKATAEFASNGRTSILQFVVTIAYKGRHHIDAGVLIDNFHVVRANHSILLANHTDPNGYGVHPREFKIIMGTIFQVGM